MTSGWDLAVRTTAKGLKQGNQPVSEYTNDPPRRIEIEHTRFWKLLGGPGVEHLASLLVLRGEVSANSGAPIALKKS